MEWLPHINKQHAKDHHNQAELRIMDSPYLLQFQLLMLCLIFTIQLVWTIKERIDKWSMSDKARVKICMPIHPARLMGFTGKLWAASGWKKTRSPPVPFFLKEYDWYPLLINVKDGHNLLKWNKGWGKTNWWCHFRIKLPHYNFHSESIGIVYLLFYCSRYT